MTFLVMGLIVVAVVLAILGALNIGSQRVYLFLGAVAALAGAAFIATFHP